MLSLCRFLAHRSGVLAAEPVECTARCWLFCVVTGASAWGILWSLDAVLTTAYLLCIFGGKFHSLKLIAGQVRIIN